MKIDEALEALNETLNDQEKFLRLSSLSHLVRRDCALLIFQGIIDFLKCWPQKREQGFPRKIIRQGLETVLSELGPHDEQIFTILLHSFSVISSGHDLLLDILPYCVPIEDHKLVETTSQVLTVLREILIKDASSLVPIIGSLSSMPLSSNGRQEAWKLTLMSLETLDNSDYPTVIQALFRYVSNSMEAAQAWELLRRSITSDDMLSVGVILNSFQSRDNGKLLAETYVDLLLNKDQNKEQKIFLGIDMLIMLELYQKQFLKSKLESLFDTLIKHKRFPFDKLSEQVIIIFSGERSMLHERLQASLLTLSLFLLLSPVRIKSGTSSVMMSQIQGFVLNVYDAVDRSRQEELIRSLLHLADEVSMAASCQKQKCHRQHLDTTCQIVHAVINSLAANNPASILRFKSMLLRRLTLNSHGSGWEQICSILVNLVDRGVGDGIDSTELMVLLQKLLFCSSGQRRDHVRQQTNKNDIEKVARGVVLATYMTQSPAFSSHDQECMYQWIQNILLPTNRRTVMAKIGSTGLKFLSQWSKKSERRAVFQQIKMILANTGLVQAKESYRSKNQVVFGYEETPSCFLKKDDSELSIKKRRHFLFCVDSYLQYKDVTNPSDWEDEIFWVYCLVNMYLEEGRLQRKSKWQPDGWLEALLELPLVEFKDTSKIEMFDKFNVDISNNVVSDDHKETRLRVSIAKDNFLARKVQVEHLLRLLLGLCLSMSLSIAVLRNSHSHLNNMKATHGEQYMNNRRRIVISRLLKYQFLKLYDLKKRIGILCALLLSIAISLRRSFQKNVELGGVIHQIDLLEEASKSAEIIVRSKLLFNFQCLPIDALKVCLIDEQDDQCLFKSNETKDQLNMIVSLRTQLLQHAVTFSHENPGNDACMDPQVIIQSVSLVIKLFENTNPNKRYQENKNSSYFEFRLLPLLSSYLGYITCAVNFVVQVFNDKPGESSSMLRNLIHNKDKLGDRDRLSLVLVLFEQFLQLLPQSFDAVIALQVLEILSLLAQVDPVTLAPKALDACWRVMHTIYSNNAEYIETLPPFTAFKQISNGILNSDVGDVARKVLRMSIIKYAATRFRRPCKYVAIRESLLLLWSLLVITPTNVRDENAILSGLVDDLQAYVETPSGACTAVGKKKKDNNKKASRTNHVSKIQSLDGSSLLIYIELILHMIIAAFAIIEPCRITQCNYVPLGPFSHIQHFPLLFKRILLLIDQSVTVLPKRFVSLTYNACHQMLQLSVFKARQCVDWRQSQPLLSPSERKAGKHDNASIVYLEGLLKFFGISCVGVVINFCQEARNRFAKATESGEEPDPFAANDSKLVALLMASERTLDTLRTIATHHNIVLPTCELSIAHEKDKGALKRVTLNSGKVKGYHHERSTFDEKSVRMKKKRRLSPTIVMACQEERSDSEHEWEDLSAEGSRTQDENSDATEDSFRVNWRSRHNEEDNESEESSVSGCTLQLDGGVLNLCKENN